MIQNILFIAIGFAMLMIGANWLVSGASTIARKYHIPEIVIGLTIVSIGTSMPELMVSVTSAISGHSDIAIGNVLGSNLCNLLLILGLTSVITPLVFNKTTKKYDIPIMIISSAITFSLALIGKSINRIDGLVLLFAFICFIIYTIKIAKSGANANKDGNSNVTAKEVIFSIVKIVAGIALLKFGGDLSVDNAVLVAKALGVAEKVIGVTIIAIGTSLPELITSVVAAIRKETDIAIGNIVGSNIFNILMILGVSAIISPITYSISYNLDFSLVLLTSVILLCFACFGKKDTMTRFNGFIYLLMYALYMVFILI